MKHINSIAETKGDMSSFEFRKIKETKAHCARKPFCAISDEKVKLEIVNKYDRL